MTVRAILNAKGHNVLSVPPDAKLSAAVKILSERRIGAVLVMRGVGGLVARPVDYTWLQAPA